MNPSVVPGFQAGTEKCPLCASAISRAKFLQITKIADEERQKHELERARLRQDAEEQFAAVAKERDEATARIGRFEQEKQRIRTQATQEAEARAKRESDQLLKAALKERDQIAAKVKQLEASKQKDVDQVRFALEKDRDDKLSKLHSEHRREVEALQKTATELQRKIERKTAAELGDGAEIDVHALLQQRFQKDEFTRIKKGAAGADIRHDVRHRGTSCGTVLYDSKNRQAWQSSYITKLRDDQIADKADFAVLTTRVFPSGRKNLFVDAATGVIVVSPAHVEWIVDVLRRTMIQMHVLRLSAQQRADSSERLYQYIISNEYRDCLAESQRLTASLLTLEVDEKHAHETVWKKRGTMVSRLKRLLSDIDSEVDAIVQGDDPAQPA